MGWLAWLEEGVPGPQTRLDLFRLVVVGDFPSPHYDVPRWIWFSPDREVCVPSRDIVSGLYPGLFSFRELHIHLRREHIMGLCQWGELAIRRLRRQYRPFPFYFGDVFRESKEAELGTDLATLGRFGVGATWGSINSGVRNPQMDSPINLDFGGPNEQDEAMTPVVQTLPTGAIEGEHELGKRLSILNLPKVNFGVAV